MIRRRLRGRAERSILDGVGELLRWARRRDDAHEEGTEMASDGFQHHRL